LNGHAEVTQSNVTGAGVYTFASQSSVLGTVSSTHQLLGGDEQEETINGTSQCTDDCKNRLWFVDLRFLRAHSTHKKTKHWHGRLSCTI